jgi:hypothetical protein
MHRIPLTPRLTGLEFRQDFSIRNRSGTWKDDLDMDRQRLCMNQIVAYHHTMITPIRWCLVLLGDHPVYISRTNSLIPFILANSVPA